MIDSIIPLLNAQQQGMSSLVNSVVTRSEVIAQASQDIVGDLIKEENQKLNKVADDPAEMSVSEREHDSPEFAEHEDTRREPEDDVDTAPSYHNPMAGKLLNTKV